MIKMFKTKNELAPPTMDSIFERRNESYITFVIFEKF